MESLANWIEKTISEGKNLNNIFSNVEMLWFKAM